MDQISVYIAPGQPITALIYQAQTKTRLPATLILAHGAGAPQLHPFMVSFARAFSERGVDVVTFNFLYAEHRRKVPDRMPQLITCYRAVIDAARAQLPSARARLFIGGKSMGGRVAQWLALDHPQKIRSLVLSGSGSGKYSELLEDYPRGVPMDAALEMIEKGYEKYQHDHWGPGFMFSEQFMKEHPEVVKKYQELIVDEVPPLKCYLRHVVARQCHETTDIVDRIKAPTLVIVGSKDTHEGGTGSHVDSAKALADKIAGSEFVLVEGGRHWAIVAGWSSRLVTGSGELKRVLVCQP